MCGAAIIVLVNDDGGCDMAITDELGLTVKPGDLQLVFQRKPRHKHSFTEAIGLANILSNLAAQTEGEFIRREHVDDVLASDGGMQAILALNGFSMATLAKIVHMARTSDDENLRKLLRFKDWNIRKFKSTKFVWDADRIEEQTMKDAAFRAGIVSLFYEGVTISTLHDHFSPREMKKLSIARMSFEPFSVIETLVDYGLYYEQARSAGEALTILGKQLES